MRIVGFIGIDANNLKDTCWGGVIRAVNLRLKEPPQLRGLRRRAASPPNLGGEFRASRFRSRLRNSAAAPMILGRLQEDGRDG